MTTIYGLVYSAYLCIQFTQGRMQLVLMENFLFNTFCFKITLGQEFFQAVKEIYYHQFSHIFHLEVVSCLYIFETYALVVSFHTLWGLFPHLQPNKNLHKLFFV